MSSITTMGSHLLTRKETLNLQNLRLSIRVSRTSLTFPRLQWRAKENPLSYKRLRETRVKMCCKLREIKLVAIAILFGTELQIVLTILKQLELKNEDYPLEEAREEEQASKVHPLVEHQSLMECLNWVNKTHRLAHQVGLTSRRLRENQTSHLYLIWNAHHKTFLTWKTTILDLLKVRSSLPPKTLQLGLQVRMLLILFRCLTMELLVLRIRLMLLEIGIQLL